jgi:hypothetical protein
MTLNIETPALLFSATSLILLAYTNRFNHCVNCSRLKKIYDEKEKTILLEIKNQLTYHLNSLHATFRVCCLFLSVFAMLLLFLDQQLTGIYLLG